MDIVRGIVQNPRGRVRFMSYPPGARLQVRLPVA
jgi:hypothetical protein